VREDDLFEALTEGRLAGAGIDVWADEPTSSDNPLFALENIVATPHAAGMTVEGRGRSNPTAARQALKILKGDLPDNLVNPDVWDHRRDSHDLEDERCKV
jgi:D-3-phosphoglycerate dehydrogenase